MTRNLAVVISGGALVLALGAAGGALGADGTGAATAGVAPAKVLGQGWGDGTNGTQAPAYDLPPPIIDDASVQAASSHGNDPPIIDD